METFDFKDVCIEDLRKEAMRHGTLPITLVCQVICQQKIALISENLVIRGKQTSNYFFGRYATSSTSNLVSPVNNRLICTHVAAGKSFL